MGKKIFGNKHVNVSIEFLRERDEKTERIDRLRKEYIKLFTQRDALLTTERDTLFCRYVNLIGRKKYENFGLSVRVRALIHRIHGRKALNFAHRDIII